MKDKNGNALPGRNRTSYNPDHGSLVHLSNEAWEATDWRGQGFHEKEVETIIASRTHMTRIRNSAVKQYVDRLKTGNEAETSAVTVSETSCSFKGKRDNGSIIVTGEFAGTATSHGKARALEVLWNFTITPSAPKGRYPEPSDDEMVDHDTKGGAEEIQVDTETVTGAEESSQNEAQCHSALCGASLGEPPGLVVSARYPFSPEQEECAFSSVIRRLGRTLTEEHNISRAVVDIWREQCSAQSREILNRINLRGLSHLGGELYELFYEGTEFRLSPSPSELRVSFRGRASGGRLGNTHIHTDRCLVSVFSQTEQAEDEERG